MEIHIRIEKKHLYALVTVLVLTFGMLIVFAGHGDSSLPAPTTGIFHYLQDIVKGDTKTTVDADNNGVIDSSDACDGDLSCDVNSIKLTPRSSAPTSPDNTIWYQS